MKKAGTLLLLILLFGFFTEGMSQALKNGFSVKAQLGFPSSGFGWPEDVPDDYGYSINYGLQLGNQWYLYTQESIGIALMVNWVDGTVATKEEEISGVNVDRITLDISVLEFGPLFTYAISDPMAIDVYYNLRPTIMSTAYKLGNEDAEGFGGFGFTHAFGGGFRYHLLYVGVEYVTGKAKISQDTTDEEFWNDRKMMADGIRIVVGIKI